MTHWVSPFGKQITEFAGHNEDCGPCGNEVCLAVVQERAPTTAHMNAIRQRDIDAGILRPTGNKNPGQTVRELVKDVQLFEKGVRVQLTPEAINYDTPNDAYFEVVHQALKGAMTRHNPCVINLGNAQALPGNERRVQWHFVACVGIDDNLGYLICNGDEVPFDGTPNWVRWPQLLAAKPVAIVEYMKVGAPVISIDGIPHGWLDVNGVLKAPNGHTVVRGFRQYLLSHADFFTVLGQPVDEEYASDNVGLDNSRGPGDVQLFERGGLGYTEKDNVFPLWTGLMASLAIDEIAQLKAEITKLQAAMNEEHDSGGATQAQVLSEQAVKALKVAWESLG